MIYILLLLFYSHCYTFFPSTPWQFLSPSETGCAVVSHLPPTCFSEGSQHCHWHLFRGEILPHCSQWELDFIPGPGTFNQFQSCTHLLLVHCQLIVLFTFCLYFIDRQSLCNYQAYSTPVYRLLMNTSFIQ